MDALLTAELPAFVQKQRTFCGSLRRTAAGWASVPERVGRFVHVWGWVVVKPSTAFPVHDFRSWVSCAIVRFTKLKRVVMGEAKLFKALNRLLRKMIQCFEAFGTPHAGDPCWSDWKCNSGNATKTQARHASNNLLQTHCKRFLESKIFQMQLANHHQVSLERRVGFISSFHGKA